MKDIFVLSASDMDSIAGAKVLCKAHPDATHLSATRKHYDFPEGSILMLVRSYLKIEHIVTLSKRFEIVIFDLDISELFEAKDELTKAGCQCHFSEHDQTISDYLWNHCFPGKSTPVFLKHVYDYMRWEFKLNNSLAIHYAYENIDSKFGNNSQGWFNALLSDDAYILNRMIEEGKQIEQYLLIVHGQLNKELCFKTTLEDHSLICANIPGVNSLFFSKFQDIYSFDAAVVFGYQPSIHRIRHTIYRINEDIDVGTIAKQHGGGGHAYAAGFTTPGFLFNIMESDGGEVDYDKIISSSLMSAPVLKHIEMNIYAWQKNAFYGTIFGENAVFYNSPYLVQTNFFSSVSTRDCKIKVQFCLNGQGLYRIACQSVDGMPLPSKFGKRFGNYSVDIVPHLHHAVFNDDRIKQDIFAGNNDV